MKLTIVGVGPDYKRLKSLSSRNVKFTGYVSENEKRELIQKCLVLLHPQFEDFGITPLEAMACGKLVIAYGNGGALETVIAGKTGEFFNKQDKDSLKKVLVSLKAEKYSKDECKNRAKEFDVSVFRKKIYRLVKNI